MRATAKCPYCNKIAEVISETSLTALKRIQLKFKCGHTVFEKLGEVKLERDMKWEDFFPYQRDSIKFLESANFKVLIAHEMGLGKTIVAHGALRYNYDKLTPCLIVCKASLIFNWIREYFKWVTEDNESLVGRHDIYPIPVMDGQTTPIAGFKVYFVSMDLLSKPKIQTWIKEYGFKTVIVDESHHFKNINSKRTSAINTACQDIPYRICLSGTPILNNALEYWPTLNLIRPEHFPSRNRFIQHYIDYDFQTKKYLGLKKYARDDFFRMTDKYVLRYEKKDVLKDLPPLRTTSQVISSFDRTFASAYNKTLDELDRKLSNMKDSVSMKIGFMDILALLAKLRHIVGLAKVSAAYEYVKEFLESTPETSKICIGIHHKDVALWLSQLLAKYNPVLISGADSPEEKQRKEDLFRTSTRIAICNILAVGEGRNFQFCSNAIVLERQWNRAKEAQFEGRFQRPIKCTECDALYIKVSEGTDIPYYKCSKCGHTTDIVPIQIDYLIASSTIDEFFDKLVQLKKAVVDSTMAWDFETDYNAIYRLAEECVQARMKAGA